MKSHDLKKKTSKLGRTDRQTDQLNKLKSCMHATRNDGKVEDRKVRSMFESSCVAEHATRLLHYGIIRFFETNFIASHYQIVCQDNKNKNENENHRLNSFTLHNQNSSVIVLDETL